MDLSSLQYVPVEGKTYSLFGTYLSTSEYYIKISRIADQVLKRNPDLRSIIDIIERFSSRKKYLVSILKGDSSDSFIAECLHLVHNELSQFTLKTEEHLKNMPLFNLWDRRLGTTREQYHLYMLEIELTNRLNIIDFESSDKKIALMPYCLQDFSVDCKSAINGLDYQCRHCSGRCFQNQADRILKNHNIEPYIWRGMDMKKFVKAMLKKGYKPAIFGIACIPELIGGIRKCRKYGIPALGLPLNANRCIRWFGEFFPNSVDLVALENLLSGSKKQ